MSNEVSVTMSPTVGAIGAALAKAQLAMGPAVKDGTNPHFKNKYATLTSCFEACAPLQENGIAVLQPPAQSGPDGVCVATLLVHSSGEWIRGELYMPASKRDPQGFGSALSYARRYCLCSTVGLTSDDDDGETASRSRSESRYEPEPSLAPALAASIDMNEWKAWETRMAATLRNAKTMGQLHERWSDVVSEKAPNGIPQRLGLVKDEMKKKLQPADSRP